MLELNRKKFLSCYLFLIVRLIEMRVQLIFGWEELVTNGAIDGQVQLEPKTWKFTSTHTENNPTGTGTTGEGMNGFFVKIKHLRVTWSDASRRASRRR